MHCSTSRHPSANLRISRFTRQSWLFSVRLVEGEETSLNFPWNYSNLIAQSKLLLFSLNQSLLGRRKGWCGKLSWPPGSEFPRVPIPPSSVQSLSRVWLFATPWTAARQASLSINNSQNLFKPMSIKLVMPSSHLILCLPLLLLPSIFPSISNDSVPHIRWSKY